MALTGLRTAPPRLVATDLDGTFLDDAERVPLRLRRAVTRLDAAGVQLVLATGRPARWVLPVVEQLTVRPLCLCGNGAVLFDSSPSRIVDIRTIDSQTQHFVVMVARAALGEVGTAVERDVGGHCRRAPWSLMSSCMRGRPLSTLCRGRTWCSANQP